MGSSDRRNKSRTKRRTYWGNVQTVQTPSEGQDTEPDEATTPTSTSQNTSASAKK